MSSVELSKITPMSFSYVEMIFFISFTTLQSSKTSCSMLLRSINFEIFEFLTSLNLQKKKTQHTKTWVYLLQITLDCVWKSEFKWRFHDEILSYLHWLSPVFVLCQTLFSYHWYFDLCLYTLRGGVFGEEKMLQNFHAFKIRVKTIKSLL